MRRWRDSFPNDTGPGSTCFPNIRAQFHDAGHILGSAVTEIEAREGSNVRRICFTGDLGRRGMPHFARSGGPARVRRRDHREHPTATGSIPVVDNENELAAMVREQARRGGRTIIPAFSVGRTQNLVYALYRIYKRGAAPRLPIFVDSPLSTQVTKIVSNNPEYFDDEALAVLGAGARRSTSPRSTTPASVEESIALNDRKGPSSSSARRGCASRGASSTI